VNEFERGSGYGERLLVHLMRPSHGDSVHVAG
jgi:hypothetical protein